MEVNDANKQSMRLETIHGKQGSYVKLADRAEHLINALENLGQAHQREGLNDAVDVKPHSKELWGTFKRNTPRVVDGAQRNQQEFEMNVKREFYKSTGLYALKRAAIVHRPTHDAIGRIFWRGFQSDFGGVGKDVVNARNRFKTKMRRHIKHQEKFDSLEKAA